MLTMKKIQFNLTDQIDLNENKYQRATALLAVFQSARLIMPKRTVQQNMHAAAYQTLYQSIFVRDYKNVLDVYGGDLKNLLQGGEAFYISSSFQQHDKQKIVEFIGARETLEEFKQIKVQAMLILRLQKRMFARRQAVERMMEIMGSMHEQQASGAIDSTTMQQMLAQQLQDLFAKHQGFISKRLLTNQSVLQENPRLAIQVYCALFAGVRAAYIWRQLGGGVLKDFFWRAAVNPMRLYAEMHR